MGGKSEEQRKKGRGRSNGDRKETDYKMRESKNK